MTLEREIAIAIAIVTAAAAGTWPCAAGGRALGFQHHALWTPMLADVGT